MAELFKVEIITPDRLFYEGEAEFIEFTTIAGDIGVYAKHIPMTTVLAPGAVAVHNGEEVVIAAVHSGFAEILGDKVTLLVEVAEWPDEIDVSRAEAAKDRAEERISNKSIDIDTRRAEIALKRALTRLDVAGR